MVKYRPCPSIIAMFTSDSQHPPRSKHAVYLGALHAMHGSRGYNAIGFFSNTGPYTLENHKATSKASQLLKLGHHQTPFKCRFAGGP